MGSEMCIRDRLQREQDETRFSLHYVVATAHTQSRVRLAAYEPAQLDDVRTRELMNRLDVRVDPAIDAAFPGQRAARVEITTRGGVSWCICNPISRATRNCRCPMPNSKANSSSCRNR